MNTINNIMRIEYKEGMLSSLKDSAACESKVFEAPNIPTSVLKTLEENKILEAGGRYGDPTMGDPIQYEWLKILTTEAEIKIEFFNRAITLFTTDSELVRRLHRFLCSLDV